MKRIDARDEMYSLQRESVRKEIVAIMTENLSSFRQCYYQKNKNNIRGAVTLVFFLGKDGKPFRAGVGESKLPISLSACLIAVLWKLQFPAPPGDEPLKVYQPLRF